MKLLLLLIFLIARTLADEESITVIDRGIMSPVPRLTLAKPFGRFFEEWDVEGLVLSTNNEIRLTPDQKGKSGGFWSKQSMDLKAFALEAEFRFTASDNFRADGAAIWFVSEPSVGPSYGVSSNFTGIGVVMDIFENTEAKAGDFIALIASHGNQSHNMETNGKEMRLGKCSVSEMVTSYRDSAETVTVYVEYVSHFLRVFYKSTDQTSWVFCTQAMVHIPLGFTMGVSASTGDLAATHELLALRMFEIPLDGEIYKAITMGGDKLKFQKTMSKEEHETWASIFAVFAFVIFAAIVVFGTLLCYDQYYNEKNDRWFS